MPSHKKIRAERSLERARSVVDEVRGLLASGQRDAADEALRHAYHEGARPTDILAQWGATIRQEER